jgi:hypothetical protein
MESNARVLPYHVMEPSHETCTQFCLGTGLDDLMMELCHDVMLRIFVCRLTSLACYNASHGCLFITMCLMAPDSRCPVVLSNNARSTETDSIPVETINDVPVMRMSVIVYEY